MKAIRSLREANHTLALAIGYFPSCEGSCRFVKVKEGEAMSNRGGCWLGLRVWPSGLLRHGLDDLAHRSWSWSFEISIMEMVGMHLQT